MVVGKAWRMHFSPNPLYYVTCDHRRFSAAARRFALSRFESFSLKGCGFELYESNEVFSVSPNHSSSSSGGLRQKSSVEASKLWNFKMG
jgi:hypothetical protein